MKSEKEVGATGAICGDGLCPYVPCKNFPKCNHLEKRKGEPKYSELPENVKDFDRVVARYILENFVSKDEIMEELFDLFEGKTQWEYQCPPERDGAIIGLLHCLGAGWEEAKTICLNSISTKDLVTHIALLRDRIKKIEK